ncbi:MAG: hypothetical protein ACREKL_10405 [Chthoniobacterales bacterium]
MSEAPASKKLQELLSTMYSNIVQFAHEDMLPAAEKNFYSTRDYALGDTVSCTAEAALENCEQIKSFLVGTAPKSALDNIDAVQHEIRRLAQTGQPFLAGKLWLLIILAAISFFIYFVMTHRN